MKTLARILLITALFTVWAAIGLTSCEKPSNEVKSGPDPVIPPAPPPPPPIDTTGMTPIGG